jgi:hypothetical protein
MALTSRERREKSVAKRVEAMPTPKMRPVRAIKNRLCQELESRAKYSQFVNRLICSAMNGTSMRKLGCDAHSRRPALNFWFLRASFFFAIVA